jgi:hypothetical protein
MADRCSKYLKRRWMTTEGEGGGADGSLSHEVFRMNIRSRHIASLVAGLSLAVCGLVHADASEYRYGPKETLVKNRATTASSDAQQAIARAKQEVKDRGNPVFAAGPRNTILSKGANESAMLSRAQ